MMTRKTIPTSILIRLDNIDSVLQPLQMSRCHGNMSRSMRPDDTSNVTVMTFNCVQHSICVDIKIALTLLT